MKILFRKKIYHFLVFSNLYSPLGKSSSSPRASEEKRRKITPSVYQKSLFKACSSWNNTRGVEERILNINNNPRRNVRIPKCCMCNKNCFLYLSLSHTLSRLFLLFSGFAMKRKTLSETLKHSEKENIDKITQHDEEIV